MASLTLVKEPEEWEFEQSGDVALVALMLAGLLVGRGWADLWYALKMEARRKNMGCEW